MGTRNLTCVFHDGKYKVAQYCQWDGYPEGQGKTVLEFCRALAKGANRKRFEKQLSKCRFVSAQEMGDLYESVGISRDCEWISVELANKFKEVHPQLDRDMGAKVLNFILKNKSDDIKLQDSLSFAGDGLFCEWCYVIDLDKKTLEVYRGLDKGRRLAKTERFANLAVSDTGYSQVGLLKSFKLSKLPSYEKFLDDLGCKKEK